MSFPAVLVTVRNGQTHGMSGSRVYKIWVGMLSRCRIPSATSYENYGGRGIRVCERWIRFEDFFADMGHPLPGQSIEREDSNGNYEPSNCRWATRLEQNRNRRDLRYLTFAGKTLCLSQWAELTGAGYDTLRGRLDHGWTVEKTLTTPVRAHKEYERRAV